MVAIGQLARRVVAIGQLSLGVFSFGQLSAGPAWAGGRRALGGTSGFARSPWACSGPGSPGARRRPVSAAQRPWTLALRAAVLAGLAALVGWLAVWPVVDALLRPGGVFLPLPGMR